MRGLDTNVLIRFLIADDPVQAEAVKREIDDARRRNERLFLSAVVLCELILVGWKNREAGCRDTLTCDGKLRGHENFFRLS